HPQGCAACFRGPWCRVYSASGAGGATGATARTIALAYPVSLPHGAWPRLQRGLGLAREREADLLQPRREGLVRLAGLKRDGGAEGDGQRATAQRDRNAGDDVALESRRHLGWDDALRAGEPERYDRRLERRRQVRDAGLEARGGLACPLGRGVRV